MKGSPDVSIESLGDKSEIVKAEKMNSVSVIYVNICLSNGIKIEHRRLSYGELICFITKQQSLCLA